MKKLKIYVASSWRNPSQPGLIQTLRAAGYDVYDFRNPAPGDNGFAWEEIDPSWREWSPSDFREALSHPTAVRGFRSDMDALMGCDVCVLLLPCGRSAHLEAGYAVGAGKTVFVLLHPDEPELMYRMTQGVCCSVEDLLDALSVSGG